VVVSGLFVVSGLAPRWGAQRPLVQALRFGGKNAATFMPLLRSPVRGKPAHHNRPYVRHKYAENNT